MPIDSQTTDPAPTIGHARRLEGRVIVVTGAGSGQGAAEARRVHDEGAAVVLTDVREEEVHHLAASLGDRALGLRHDVSSTEDWARVREQSLDRFGAIDGLVNNAAAFFSGALRDTDAATLDRLYSVNVRGAFLGIYTLTDALAASGRGAVVNTASNAGMRGIPGLFAYSVTKWAVRGLTQCAARELAEHKIRVNALLPGPVDTPMFHASLNVHGQESGTTGLSVGSTDVDGLIAQVPLKRIAQPSEMAAIVAFLLSDEAGFVTGAELVADGGLII